MASRDLSPTITGATPKSAAGEVYHPCVFGVGFDPHSGGHARILIDGNAHSPHFIAAAPDLLAEAREICAILDLYRAETGEEPCFDHEAIGEEVARRHASLTAAIAKATSQASEGK